MNASMMASHIDVLPIQAAEGNLPQVKRHAVVPNDAEQAPDLVYTAASC